MRSKAPLALMEQLVMVLVFALSAAVCVQVFSFCHRASLRCQARDQAAILCQNAAERLKSSGGAAPQAILDTAEEFGVTASYDGNYLALSPAPYTADWTLCPQDDQGTGYSIDGAAYYLYFQEEPSGVPGLAQVRVWVTAEGQGGDPLFSLPVAWQEVSP